MPLQDECPWAAAVQCACGRLLAEEEGLTSYSIETLYEPMALCLERFKGEMRGLLFRVVDSDSRKPVAMFQVISYPLKLGDCWSSAIQRGGTEKQPCVIARASPE